MTRFKGRLSILLIWLILPLMPAGGQVLFEYRHNAGDRWHLVSEADEEVLVDGELYYRTDILNKISVEILRGDGRDGLLWNLYSIAETRKGSDVYIWSGEYEAEYGRDVRGRLSGFEENDAVPTVRGVPTYPDYAVEPGESWTAPGQEVSDLDPVFGIPVVMKIDFDAAYTYIGPEEAEGREMDRVVIDYGFDWQPDSSTRSVFSEYAFYPVKIEGRFRQELLWDRQAGRNWAEEGEFSHTYHMNDGHSYTFRGRSRGQAIYVDPMDREALVDEIEDLGQDDLTVEAVDEGVKISLENINFVPDRAVMLPGQEEKLAGILEILSRYPNRDVRVIGHTARVAGDGDGQELSELRAETVAKLIIDSQVRSPERISVRGMGNREPLADNGTEEGRRMNRRVEIVILEN